MCLGSFNEDDYRDRQTTRYLESLENESDLSNCCNSDITEDGLCSCCDEHCVSNHEHYENLRDDQADQQRELEREISWDND